VPLALALGARVPLALALETEASGGRARASEISQNARDVRPLPGHDVG